MGDSRGPCRARPGRVPRQSPRRPAHAEVLLLAPTSNFASLNDRVTLSSSVAWLERPATPRLAVTEGARPRGAPGVLEGLRSSAVSLGSHLRPALVAHFRVDSPVVGAVSPGGEEGVVVLLWLSGESGWGSGKSLQVARAQPHWMRQFMLPLDPDFLPMLRDIQGFHPRFAAACASTTNHGSGRPITPSQGWR